MLEDLVQKQFAVARHLASVFGPHLDAYLGELRRRGHRRAVLRRHLILVTRFGEFLAANGIHQIGAVRREHVDAFLRHELGRLRRKSRAPARLASVARSILSDLGRHLEAQGLWRTEEARGLGLMDGLYRSLAVERGLQPCTIGGYRHFVGKFLEHLGSDGSAESLAHVAVRDVDDFIVSAGRTYGRGSMRHVCTAIRALLRHLHREGVLGQDLSVAVIMPRFYALERLPCALPWETVRRVIDAVDLTAPCGQRDRAILMILVTYGVRPGEIVKLRLEDIDWRRDLLHLRRSKNGRPLCFPLTRDVGEAVVAYLRHGRPPTTVREIFVRCDAPHAAFGRGSAVSNIVRRCLAKAGIRSPHTGAYVIRHSLAVQLLRKRNPLKTITDMLGHRDPLVAYHYAKLATEDLHGVALEAREVLP